MSVLLRSLNVFKKTNKENNTKQTTTKHITDTQKTLSEYLNFISTESQNFCNSEGTSCWRKCGRTTEILWLTNGIWHSWAESCHGSRNFSHEWLDYYPDNSGIVFIVLFHSTGWIQEWKGLAYDKQMGILGKYMVFTNRKEKGGKQS